MHFVDSLYNYIEVKESRFGNGLFALQDIPPDVAVCPVQGEYISFKETLLLGDKESHALQVGIDKYILCQPPFLYSNHSCEPNCGLNANLELVTLKPIIKGEEIFWDYSTSLLERHWTMDCSCGTDSCRTIITDFDLLPFPLQEQYIKLKIVLPFITNELLYKIAI